VGEGRSSSSAPSEEYVLYTLGPMRPTDLCPILHVQHLTIVNGWVRIHPEPEGQFSAGTDSRPGSVKACGPDLSGTHRKRSETVPTRVGCWSRSPVEIVVVPNQFAGRLGSARNTAPLQARADIVAFLDDDAGVAPDWLERLLAVYAMHPEAVAVGGTPRPNYGAPRPSWFPPDFDWVLGCHP
jgi:cellulose synthase/poly-beta-1,6-N-acetylglucosamine synthase-like glycosyltransferase